jgi:hypothetical protein
MLRPLLRRELLRDIYVSCQAEGITNKAAAELLGITPSMVSGDRRALGLARPRGSSKPGDPARTVNANRASVKVRQERAVNRTAKVCPQCPERGEQDLSAFGRDRNRPDGRSSWCRACAAEVHRIRLAAARDRRAREAGRMPPTDRRLAGRKTCNACGVEKDLAEFHRNRSVPDGRQGRCKACMAAGPERKPREAPAGPVTAELLATIDPAWQAEQQAKAIRWPAPVTVTEVNPCCYGSGGVNGQDHARSCPFGRATVS